MSGTASFDWILSRLPADRPLRLLDVGCGECAEAAVLLASGVELTGVDSDEAAIARARAAQPHATFIAADASTLPEGWQPPFDVVLLRRPDLAATPGTWRRIVSSVPSWLTPRGRVIVSTPGASEAEAARRWLDEAGLAVTPTMQLGADGERYFVTAARPAPPLTTDHPLVWGDERGAALVCDLATGSCSAPADPPTTEKHDG